MPAIEEKWELFGKVYYWELVFFASQMFSFAGLHVYLQLVHGTVLSVYITIDIFESVVESLSIFCICYLVRVQPPMHSLNIQWEETDDWEIPLYFPLCDAPIEMGNGSTPVLVVAPGGKTPNSKCYFLGIPASELA